LDAEGNRLYATFFYVDLRFPESAPMASLAENDRVEVVSRIARFGGSMLDGVTWLLPLDGSGPVPALESAESAVAAGIPSVRLSNIFVRQFGGAEWLKKSRPANPGFETIRELAAPPDCSVAVKDAEKNGHFELPGPGYVPLISGETSTDYKLIPERDVNGAGLVYFANYPVFLDICEREALKSAELPISEELCARRTVVRRRSAYLNNASWKDGVTVFTSAWVQNPFAMQHSAPEMAAVKLFTNQRMYRKSDGRLMMVSTAEKMLFSTAMEQLPFFDRLEHK
jgi:probable biosynthetic protein (TIGR04098 family)